MRQAKKLDRFRTENRQPLFLKAVYVDFLFERRGMLFDLGDISALPTRKLLRLSHVFVSHTHVDHFIGFDHLLRLLVGRDQRLRLYGPPDFAGQVAAKLSAYTWNLADRYRLDLRIDVSELSGAPFIDHARTVRFRLKTGFTPEALGEREIDDGAISAEPDLTVCAALLEHRTPCLGFALEERFHINVWRNRLEEQGLATGPWLNALKAAIREERPDETPIRVARRAGAGEGPETLSLGPLRQTVVSITPGQKIGYVTDVAHTEENRSAIFDLVRGADVLFIEAAFAAADAELAADRAHLTTEQAGTLARDAGVARVEPFHFSVRYEGEEGRMLEEVERACQGGK